MCLHVEETPFPFAVSGCLSQIGRTPILVGLTCLRALQFSGYGWIKAIIHFCNYVNVLSIAILIYGIHA